MNPTPSSSLPASGADFDWAAPTSPGTPEAASQATNASFSSEVADADATKRGWLTGTKARIAAMVAAGALVGGGAALAVDHSSGSSATSTGVGTSGAGNTAGGFTPGSGTTGMSGITPTAYRLSGTITAINPSTVTIKTSSGSKTYTVTSSTHLLRNGSSVSLSAFLVGDSVVGSTTTSGGTTLNDMVYGMGQGGGPGSPGGAVGAGTGSASGTSTSTSTT